MENLVQQHWEKVYATKQPHEVSWTQERPHTSLEFIESFGLPKTARIIDIGGGDSRLVDALLDLGYENITVLDISANALERARQRLGPKANSVQWIVADIRDFHPTEQYDLWHDRATFHFLTTDAQVESYLEAARAAVRGFMTIGTFSQSGPTKCSGLEVRQYSGEKLQRTLADGFHSLRCIAEDHVTPFGTVQNFTFCGFQRTQGRIAC